MIIDPHTLSQKDIYHLMTSCVVPRRIALVTSMSVNGVVNAAPFSYFNAISSSPPVLMIAVSRRNGAMKDTARNIHDTREFVVNVVNEDIAEKMNIASAPFPPDVSEIPIAGFSTSSSERVKVPRIAESPVHLECVLSQWIEVGTEPTDLILGEVVLYHVRDDLMEGNRLNVAALKAVGRLSGSLYCRTTDIFSMKRPMSPNQVERREG